MKIFCFTQFSRNFPVKMKMRSPPSVWIFVTTTGCVHGLKTPFSPRNPPKTSRLPSARSNCMAFSRSRHDTSRHRGSPPRRWRWHGTTWRNPRGVHPPCPPWPISPEKNGEISARWGMKKRNCFNQWV